MNNLAKKVTKGYQAVAVVFLLLLFLSVLIQIIMRNVFHAGSIQLEELARVSLVSLVFLMIPVLTFEKKHIIVDIVLLYLPKQAKKWVSVVTQLLAMCFGIYVLWAIATIMERNWSVRTPALNMPNVVFYIPITLGIFAMTVLSLLGVWMTIGGKEEEV